MGDPRYDVLSNRGYTGAPYGAGGGGGGGSGPPPSILKHQQQYAERPSEPLYSQIQMQGGGPRGQADLVTRNAPPPPSSGVNYPGGGRSEPRGGGGGGGAWAGGGYAGGGSPRQQHHQDMGGVMAAYPRDQPDFLPPRPQQHQNQPGNIQAVLGIPAQLQDPNALPPPLPPEPKPVGWVCQCTWLNKPHRPSCEMCMTDRPADYVVPDDAPVDEATRKAQENDMLIEKV